MSAFLFLYDLSVLLIASGGPYNSLFFRKKHKNLTILKKQLDPSYSFGAFATFALMKRVVIFFIVSGVMYDFQC